MALNPIGRAAEGSPQSPQPCNENRGASREALGLERPDWRQRQEQSDEAYRHAHEGLLRLNNLAFNHGDGV